MRRSVAALGLAGTLGLGLVGAVAVPAIASAATSDSTVSEAVGDRVTQLSDALSGLVDDGTITQDQADAVAETLSEPGVLGGPGGHGGPGRGPGGMGGMEGTDGVRPGGELEAAAEVLGLEADAIHDALHDGTTIADLAEQEGVDLQDVIDALVASAQERLDAAVEDGSITAAQAEERSAELTERITAFVEETRPARGEGGPGRSQGGPGELATPSTPGVPDTGDTNDDTNEDTEAESSVYSAT